MKNIFAGPATFHATDPALVEKAFNATSGIVACIEGLSTRDIHALERYARYKMAGIRGRVFDADAEDLLQAAIERMLDGRRTWNPVRVDLVKLLKECMRSITNEWYKKARNTELSDQCVSQSNDYAQAEAQLTLDRLRKHLLGESVALDIFDLLREGCPPREIRKRLKLTSKAYDAAKKKIVRRLDEAISREGKRHA